jgi:hypothetical protein
MLNSNPTGTLLNPLAAHTHAEVAVHSAHQEQNLEVQVADRGGQKARTYAERGRDWLVGQAMQFNFGLEQKMASGRLESVGSDAGHYDSTAARSSFVMAGSSKSSMSSATRRSFRAMAGLRCPTARFLRLAIARSKWGAAASSMTDVPRFEEEFALGVFLVYGCSRQIDDITITSVSPALPAGFFV